VILGRKHNKTDDVKAKQLDCIVLGVNRKLAKAIIVALRRRRRSLRALIMSRMAACTIVPRLKTTDSICTQQYRSLGYLL
jgi:hypothetical protein